MKKLFLFFVLLSSFAFGSDIDTKIGQMLIIGFDGDSINSQGYKKVLKQAKNGEISGVILFKKNIKSKKDLIKMNDKLIEKSKITPFISIDNEGGYIERCEFIHNNSAKEIADLSIKEAKEEYSSMAKNLKELKINLNFAPCVDLEINEDSIIAKNNRSYSKDPKIVTKYAKIFIEEHNKKNIITSIKHFPGHGSIEGDTHKNFVDATKTFKKEEILPYQNLKNYNKMNMVMVSHIYNSNIDDKYPASLSKKTIKGLLKDVIGFDGIIVSDDYDMKAIKDNYSLRDIVVNSINSGIDVLIFSNNIQSKDSDLPKKIKKIIKQEIKLGNIRKEDIENSYKKIISIKKKINN